MTSVIKRSGRIRDFDPEKLVASMRRAGADEALARRIAQGIQVKNGTRTSELRKRVTEELGRVSEPLADAYRRTVRLPAKSSDDVADGVVRVPRRMERIPNLKAGMPARVRHGDATMDVNAEPALDVREAWLTRKGLEALGVAEGTRVAVRFLREDEGGLSPALARTAAALAASP